MANIKAQVNQLSPDVLSDNTLDYPAMSKIGQLFTADWKTRLALAGKCYSLDLGVGGTALAGNAAFDADQPEFLIGVDTGWLIPLSLQLAVSGDFDAEEACEVSIIGDRSQCQAAGATATVEVPLNLLDGGPAFNGRAYSVVTGNITAPVESDMLFAASYDMVQVSAVSTVDTGKQLNYEWNVPVLLAGPCQIVGYVVGDATATAFSGRLVVAHIPADWVKVS